MREIRLALLEADVSYKVVKDFVKAVTERAIGADVMESLTTAQMIVKIVNEELTTLMGSENEKLKISSRPPTVVMLVGLQGAGKTTNGANWRAILRSRASGLCWWPAISTAPAAIKQLQVVGEKLEIPSLRWARPILWKSPRPPLPTPKSTATIWSFSTPPAGSTSMKPSWRS